MTHVRMSQELLGQIKKAAEETYLTANPKPDSTVNLTDTIMSALREMPAYKKTMAFFQDPDIIAVKTHKNSSIKAALDTFMSTDTIKRINIYGFKATGSSSEVCFTAQMAIPPTMFFAARYQNSLDLHIDQFVEPYRTEAVNAIQSSIDATAAWNTAFSDYTTKTNEIFDACKSTKQLLDTWGAAEKFLPKHVIQKIHEKKVESPADEAARLKRESFTSEGLDQHILLAGMLGDLAKGT